MRVEPDGSVVIAGRAAPQSQVDLLTGGGVVGGAKADATGDFAIVLDKPLAPGDYQLTLRATTPTGAAVGSAETAVVSIPKAPD
ncbi:Ig-like domain-containing protein, partial [Rhizobiaceae sp. 2RAB30]